MVDVTLLETINAKLAHCQVLIKTEVSHFTCTCRYCTCNTSACFVCTQAVTCNYEMYLKSLSWWQKKAICWKKPTCMYKVHVCTFIHPRVPFMRYMCMCMSTSHSYMHMDACVFTCTCVIMYPIHFSRFFFLNFFATNIMHMYMYW